MLLYLQRSWPLSHVRWPSKGQPYLPQVSPESTKVGPGRWPRDRDVYLDPRVPGSRPECEDRDADTGHPTPWVGLPGEDRKAEAIVFIRMQVEAISDFAISKGTKLEQLKIHKTVLISKYCASYFYKRKQYCAGFGVHNTGLNHGQYCEHQNQVSGIDRKPQAPFELNYQSEKKHRVVLGLPNSKWGVLRPEVTSRCGYLVSLCLPCPSSA